MSQILTPGERPTQWGTLGDHDRRIRALEAVDPCECFTNPSLSEYILGLTDLAAFWKLNEESGDIAYDSANGYDCNSGAFLPPTWGQAAGPPGETSARFAKASQIESRTSFPAMTGDFSAGIWANRDDTLTQALLSQGSPVSANHAGWQITIGAFNVGSGNKAIIHIGDTTGGPHVTSGTTVINASTWHLFGFSRASNIWTLYVDGVAEGTPYDDGGTNYSSTTGITLGGNLDGLASYGFVVGRALSATEWADMQTLGSGISPSGWVWTLVDGEGQWLPPTIEVEF